MTKRRTCAHPKCKTVLSMYNPSNLCFQHEKERRDEKFFGNIPDSYAVNGEVYEERREA